MTLKIAKRDGCAALEGPKEDVLAFLAVLPVEFITVTIHGDNAASDWALAKEGER